MTIYLILMMVLGIAGWLYCFKPAGFSNSKNLNQINKAQASLNKKYIIMVIVLILALVASCRGLSVGTDTHTYYEYFEYKSTSPGVRFFEPLYEALNFVVVKLHLPFNFVLFLCAIIVFSSFGVLAYRYSENPAMVFFFFVALGFFGNTFNAVRQYLALAVFLFAIKYIRDGGFIRYALLILLAYFFHSSAIILLPVYFIRYFKLTPKFIILVALLIIVGSAFLEPAVRLFSQITRFDYFGRYFSSENGEGLSIYNVLYSIGMMAVFVLLYLMRGKVKEKLPDCKNYDLFLMLFFISVALRAFGTFSGMFSIINRLNVYFFYSIIFLLPVILECAGGAVKKICVVLTFALGVAYNLISGILRGSNGVYPYKFIWGSEVIPTILFIVAFTLASIILLHKSSAPIKIKRSM